MAIRKRLVLSLIIVPCLCVVVWLTSEVWLRALGDVLVADSTPEHADAAIVLAGDPRANRIMKACDLVRNGYVPIVLVSGPMKVYGVNEADLAIRFAVSQGCPADRLQPAYIRALSTRDEARAMKPELQRRGIRSVLLVTSNFHTARAARTFRRILPSDITVRPIASVDDWFTRDGWWRNREGQKTAFMEISKTIADFAGL